MMLRLLHRSSRLGSLRYQLRFNSSSSSSSTVSALQSELSRLDEEAAEIAEKRAALQQQLSHELAETSGTTPTAQQIGGPFVRDADGPPFVASRNAMFEELLERRAAERRHMADAQALTQVEVGLTLPTNATVDVKVPMADLSPVEMAALNGQTIDNGRTGPVVARLKFDAESNAAVLGDQDAAGLQTMLDGGEGSPQQRSRQQQKQQRLLVYVIVWQSEASNNTLIAFCFSIFAPLVPLPTANPPSRKTIHRKW